MPDSTAWDEYCEASLDLSNQDDIGEPISTNPSICSGQPVFTGTRVLVSCVVERLRAGHTLPELQADYPTLSSEALATASKLAVHL